MSIFKNDKEEPQSPIDQILSSFTKNAKEMNSIAGFPGVLLLVGLGAVGLPVMPGVEPSNGLMFVAGICIFASSATYTVQWWFMSKQAEAQALMLREFTKTFLDRYLQSKTTFEAEHVDWAIENILNKLTEKKKLPNRENAIGPG